MLVKTTNCQKYNHLEFCLSYDEQVIPQVDIQLLMEFLEDEVSRGIKFQDGETLQVGWSINQIQLMNDGYLHIREPNMKDIPIIFIDSVTNTLKHLRCQKDTVESCEGNIELDFSSIISAIIVSNTYLQAQNLFISREQPEESFSGWFCRDLTNDNDNDCKIISLYEFACNRPDLIKFLAFPVGFGIYMVANSKIAILKHEDKISIKPGSFLDEINEYRLGK